MLRRTSAVLVPALFLAACSHQVTVAISPAEVTVVPGGRVTFTAKVSGSTDTHVVWSIREAPNGGKIEESGTYAAPATGGTFHVLAIPDADALQEASATVTVSSDGVLLGSTVPASPANENHPHVKGTAEPRATVEIFATAGCTGSPIGSGKAGEEGTFDVAVTVGDDSSTSFHARATSPTGVVSDCSSGSLDYVEDSTPPAAPSFTRVSPGPSGSDLAPRFFGDAEAGSTVRLASDGACENTVAEGSSGDFAGSGLAVTVAAGASITVHATATDAAGNTSACSSGSLSYHQQGGGGSTGGWRGPASRLEFVPGTNEVFIVVGNQRIRPVFVSVNPQAVQDEAGWQRLLAEIDLASRSGMPVIDLMLGNRAPRYLAGELSDHLGNRQVYLWLRFDMWVPELAGLSPPLLQSMDGTNQPGQKLGYAIGHDNHWTQIPYFSSLDETWLATEKQSLTLLLDDLAASPIGDRIIGVRPTYMAGGEWFQPPLAFHDGVLDESPPNAWPWSNPEAFSIGDYNASEQAMFANWLNSSGFGAMPFPSAAERIQPRYGRTFAVGADGSNQASALYHRFLSERIARYQSELADLVKQQTGSKALVMVNNAYLFSLCLYNGSLHTAFEKLLNSPSIDAINAPYNYNTLGSRKPGFALIPHGPMDSPALHGKIWMHEDDSRPYWSSDGFRTTTSAQEDEAMLLRNAATSLLHGNALYFFDLPNQGWYGGEPAHAAEVEAIYGKVQQVVGRIGGQLSKSGPVRPEIAVFIDDQSYHLYPEFGFDGANSYGTSNELILRMVEKVAGLGAPVRYYLLDDLGNPNLDVSAFKLVVFLNTPRLTQEHRRQIQTRLMNGGRVLYFQHVSGLFDETMHPAWSLGADYMPGMNGLSDVEASTSTAVTLVDHGAYVTAYAPHGADESALASLLARAGVHRYATNAVVDGAGSVLMVHSAGGTVNVELNAAARLVDMVTGAEACANCSSLTVNANGATTRVFELQPVGGPHGVGRLFRYEFQPGTVGGFITTDEQSYCGLPDGNALVACGYTVEDYMNAPIVPYGQLALQYSGGCACGRP